MHIVPWTLFKLDITDCAIIPNAIAPNAHSLVATGTYNGQQVAVEFPRRLRTFNIKEAVDLICEEADKIQRKDLAERLLTLAFGKNIGQRVLLDTNYFKELAAI